LRRRREAIIWLQPVDQFFWRGSRKFDSISQCGKALAPRRTPLGRHPL